MTYLLDEKKAGEVTMACLVNRGNHHTPFVDRFVGETAEAYAGSAKIVAHSAHTQTPQNPFHRDDSRLQASYHRSEPSYPILSE